SPVTICFAMLRIPPRSLERSGFVFRIRPGASRAALLLRRGCLRGSAEFGQDLFFAQNQIFFAVQLDLTAAVLAEQNPVAHLHVQWDPFALLNLACACGD